MKMTYTPVKVLDWASDLTSDVFGLRFCVSPKLLWLNAMMRLWYLRLLLASLLEEMRIKIIIRLDGIPAEWLEPTKSMVLPYEEPPVSGGYLEDPQLSTCEWDSWPQEVPLNLGAIPELPLPPKDLEEMNMKELRCLADDLKVKHRKVKKKDLIGKIRAAYSQAA